MPPKHHQKTHQQFIKTPFPHMQIQNFLTPSLHKKLFTIYNKLFFKQKQSDLFHFFQTNQLNQQKKLQFFLDELDRLFFSLQPIKSSELKKQNTFYNVFASYYFQNNYLLCHDDLIQDRKYAFSYYLQDHPSGDLILFNNLASKQLKRIKVKANTLAIFQVSQFSYHEVDLTKSDGRKAITGWFNIKGLQSQRQSKVIAAYLPTIPAAQTLTYPLPSSYLTQQYLQLNNINYQFNITKTSLQGPFYSKKVHKIQINPVVIFILQHYTLFSVQFYYFKIGDYLLLNDPINTIYNKQIVDIFVTYLPQKFKKTLNQSLVKITQPNQEPYEIQQNHDCLFFIKRNQKKYYVDRVNCKEKQFILAHFIYVKDQKINQSAKSKKNKSDQKQSKAQVKKINKKITKTQKQPNQSQQIKSKKQYQY